MSVAFFSFSFAAATTAWFGLCVSSRERTGSPNHQLFNGHQWSISHRIHGAAIYGNMDPINIPPMLAYIPYMDPMALWVLYPCQLVFRKHASWFTDCLRVVLSLTDRRRAVAVAWYDPSNVEKLDLAGGFVRWKSQPANVQKLVLQLFWALVRKTWFFFV